MTDIVNESTVCQTPTVPVAMHDQHHTSPTSLIKLEDASQILSAYCKRRKIEFHNSNWALVTHFFPDDNNGNVIHVDLLNHNHNVTFYSVVVSEIVLIIPSQRPPVRKTINTFQMQTMTLNHSSRILMM
jgi:hypothetical protein